jgi:drug resistance transporter, EmrB/QacA subfamily
VSIPLTGWLTHLFGQVRLFVTSILLFVFASWLCGIAPNLPTLLAARILQGAVAGPLAPLSQALLLGAWPRQKSSSALALWSMTALVGPIAGPSLGGWITYDYNWSWIFYINIPVGFFAAAVTWIVFRDRESATKRMPIDTVGLLLLVLWVASLQIMLDKGKDLDWFNSPVVVALGVIALIGFAFFLVWELYEANPIVYLRLFTQRNFRGRHDRDLGRIRDVLPHAGAACRTGCRAISAYRAVESGHRPAPLGLDHEPAHPGYGGRLLSSTDPRNIVTLVVSSAFPDGC